MIRGCWQLVLIAASTGLLLEFGGLRLPCGSAHVVETKKQKVCDQFQRGTDGHMRAAGVSGRTQDSNQTHMALVETREAQLRLRRLDRKSWRGKKKPNNLLVISNLKKKSPRTSEHKGGCWLRNHQHPSFENPVYQKAPSG